MNFADTNWLEALYFDAADAEQESRCGAVARFMRKAEKRREMPAWAKN
jgi:hypothetical protein